MALIGAGAVLVLVIVLGFLFLAKPPCPRCHKFNTLELSKYRTLGRVEYEYECCDCHCVFPIIIEN